MQDFRNLKVWEKAHLVAIEIYRVAESFPRAPGLALTSQLRRSALSVATNIAEGAGRDGRAEFGRFLQIALGSASETQYHLQVARDLDLIDAATHAGLSARVSEVRRMLTGLLKRVAPRTEPPRTK